MSSEISKTYNPESVETKWYAYWLENKLFKSLPSDKKPFTIVIPPPNVTGVLHMGHMLNNTIQDVLVRRARKQGMEACWVPGTDHASIATEAKVVAMLREKGIKKSDLSREDFLKYAWEWKEKYGGIILEQLKKLGASVDWDRTRFTMEPSLSDAVTEVFVDMHRKGYIYRGLRMVNWDPQGKTALSDEEVIYKEVNSKLYHIRYKISGSNQHIIVATTRPETLIGDTAVCIHPKDERYTSLKGKKVMVPLVNREIPIIEDDYVDLEFGTGCLKVTPAHDMNDYQLGTKHNLEVIDAMNDDGTFNNVYAPFNGKDRFAVRKEIVALLKEQDLLEKIEDIKNNVGYSERTDAVIEPRLSLQWFVDMKKFMKANPKVLDAVMEDEIKLYPAKFKNTYRHWIENIKDWCISRQLWWGHRIPAWYGPENSFVVAMNEAEALQEFRKKYPTITANDIKQDEDVLDTWYSSWLWPISVFDGFNDKNNKDIKFYYPTDVLVTAPEILFFWVARMIMAGYEYRGQLPFRDVYLTGIVRDKLGRKMSKSLGNSPDPIDLMKQYSADGVRFGMLLSSPAGNDLLFDEKYCEQGRNFANKVWNAFRLVKSWEIKNDPQEAQNQIAIQWMNERINQVNVLLDDHYSKFRLSEALMEVYKLIWDDFCSWYLEMVKPAFGSPIDSTTYKETIKIFERLIAILHPFMPFITEEIYQNIADRKTGTSICTAPFEASRPAEEKILTQANLAFELITQIRNTRNAKQISPKESLDIIIKTEQKEAYQNFAALIQKLSNLNKITFADSIQGPSTFMIGRDEFQIPLGELIDADKEKETFIKEIEYLKGFLLSVDKKLSNDKFVANAKPDVIEKEKQKKADAVAKIKSLEESLAALK